MLIKLNVIFHYAFNDITLTLTARVLKIKSDFKPRYI